MVALTDYLYSGDTVLKILFKYKKDLKISAEKSGNPVDMVHCDFLTHMSDLLEHNEFLTSQSQRIREFYKYMTEQYPDLAFTFKGRIKSLIRAEEKFNGYIVAFIYDYHKEHGTYPSDAEIMSRLRCFRDLIAYRIIISVPKCHILEGMDKREEELKYLYQIANQLPGFLAERGFSVQESRIEKGKDSPLLNENIRPYYKDYIMNPSPSGYQSLHITLFDNVAKSYIEVQLRTKDMDDFAEIGPANHLGYEKRQDSERKRRDEIPVGECIYFDEAFERGIRLQQLQLNELDVNMFAAANNSLINDGCGLFRGRLILPYEHLSRFQNNIID